MCKICGNPTESIEIDIILYDYCPQCRYLSKKSSFYPTKEVERSRYLQHTNGQDVQYYHYQEKFYFDIMPFMVNPCLDFGCGDGHILASILVDHSWQCDYYDLYFYSDNSIFLKQYSIIILEEVIEHFQEPMKELNSLIKLLLPQGRLVIRTQFLPKDRYANWWYLRDVTHVGFFSYETFTQICAQFSLKIIYYNDQDIIILEKA